MKAQPHPSSDAVQNERFPAPQDVANDEGPPPATGGPAPPRFVRLYDERTRLLATYLNTIAAGLAVTGVIGPMASYLYGTVTTTNRTIYQMLIEIVALLTASLAVHMIANRVLGRLT